MVPKANVLTLTAIGLIAATLPARAGDKDLVLGIIGAIASGIQQQAAREQTQPSPSFVSRPHEDYERTLLRQEIQRRLGLLGFNPGGEDGVFGPRTRQAIAGFQDSIGRDPSGKISEEEVRILYSMTERPTAAAEPVELQPTTTIPAESSSTLTSPGGNATAQPQPLEAQPSNGGEILTISPSIPLQ